MAEQQSPARSGGGISLPGSPSQQAGVPENVTFFIMDGFAGLNTKATRPAIQDQENSWCKNWMPLGKNNLRTLFDVGPALYTAASGVSVQSFHFGNIADSPLMMVFPSDGSIQQVNTLTGLVTQAGPPGTIASPAQQLGMAQWGSQYLLIVAPQGNGYLVWDGTNLYQSGTLGPEVTLTNAGLDYASQPTITAWGGEGSGATFSAELVSGGSISRIFVTNPGNGYQPSDVVVLNFTGGGSTTTASATASITAGVVSSIMVNNGGTGYGSAGAANITVELEGGGGFGATAVVSGLSGSTITSIVVTASGQGYTNSPTVVITDPNNPVAQASVTVMPFGIQGTAIETYQSRVWIANGAAPMTPPPKNLVQFTAPDAPTDFGAADGGGQFTANDSFVRVGYHGLRQSNGFLYLVGDSSINYIGGVQTTGTPPSTTFANQNVDPQIGTPWPDTLQVYSRALVFANSFGVFAMYGGAVQKVSTPIDNLYTSVTPTGTTPAYNGLIPSAAVGVVFGIHIYMLLLPVIDAITQQQETQLIMWDGQKWWTADQSVGLTYIASQEINSVLTPFGTDGHSIYPLFNTPSGKIAKIIQSKLWDTPNYIMVKLARWVTGLFQGGTGSVINGIPANITITVDTEFGSSSPINETSLFGVIWLNSSGGVTTWYATGQLVVTWLASGFVVFGPDIINTSGRLMGMTATTSAPDLTLLSLTTVAQHMKLDL